MKERSKSKLKLGKKKKKESLGMQLNCRIPCHNSALIHRKSKYKPRIKQWKFEAGKKAMLLGFQ